MHDHGFAHTHTYVPGTGVLATLETKSGTPMILTRSLSHDKMLRLRGIETKNGANAVLSRHGYTLDGAGRRTKATRENGQRWDYQYDEIGQVEDAKKKFPGSTGTIPGHDFQYTYDGIGNRLSAVEGGTGTATTGTGVTYVPNALNQYEAITT